MKCDSNLSARLWNKSGQNWEQTIKIKSEHLWLSLEKSSKARKALVGDRWVIGYSLRWKHPLSTPTSPSGVSSLYISTPPTQATLSQQNLNHISPLGPSLSQPAIALLCLKALLGLAWSCLDILSKGNVNVCVAPFCVLRLPTCISFTIFNRWSCVSQVTLMLPFVDMK